MEKTKKNQIIAVFVVIIVGFVGFFAFSSMKKPPAEKEKVDNTPTVTVQPVELAPMLLQVFSYGVVKPKYETELVAQVSGEITRLSGTFVRGGFVKSGQVLAQIDPSDYEAALIEAQASLAAAQAGLELERAHGRVAKEEWKRLKKRSPTELSLRKPQLAQELARVKAAEAAVKRAKRNLERTQISAPYDALIDGRETGMGAFVTVGSKIGKLLSVSVAEVRLPVADNQLKYLSNMGQDANVTLTGLFAGKERTWQAKIVRNEGIIDSTSRMNYLVAEIKDPYQLITNQAEVIRYGVYVNAAIDGIHLDNATRVPRHLVDKNKVAILSQDNTLNYRSLVIVRQDGAEVIISAGLNNQDQVITSALDYPVEGMKLSLASDKDNESTDNTEVAGTDKVESDKTHFTNAHIAKSDVDKSDTTKSKSVQSAEVKSGEMKSGEMKSGESAQGNQDAKKEKTEKDKQNSDSKIAMKEE